MRQQSSNSASTRARLRRAVLLGALAVVVSIVPSACGGSGSSSSPQPFDEQQVIAAFRKVGIQLPVVLRAGKSCHPERWGVAASAASTKAATLYACGRLKDANIDTSNLPQAVLMARAYATVPNYLINVYPDQLHAASTDVWLRTLLVPRKGAGPESGPVTFMRIGNVVVAGFLKQPEIASTNRAFAVLKSQVSS